MQRRASRINPGFLSGDSYEGPFTVTADVNDADEPILKITNGRFHLGTVTVEIEDSLTVPYEFGPFKKKDIVSNPAILALEVYSYGGLQFRFGLFNPNAFDQQPGNVYKDGFVITDSLTGEVVTDDNGDPVEVNTFRKALAYVTFEEVDNGDPAIDNFWEPVNIVQWWMGGDIDIPRVGRGAT